MTTIRVMVIEGIAGREYDYVRVAGTRTTDVLNRMVEVGLSVDEVAEIAIAKNCGEDVLIEVPDRSWCYCFATEAKE